MYRVEVIISDKNGLHARSASMLVQTASKFVSAITLEVNGKSINAKSFIGLLSAAIKYNSQITITADGDDEKQAVEAILQFFDTLSKHD